MLLRTTTWSMSIMLFTLSTCCLVSNQLARCPGTGCLRESRTGLFPCIIDWSLTLDVVKWVARAHGEYKVLCCCFFRQAY